MEPGARFCLWSPGAVSYLVAAAHLPSGARAPAIWKEGSPRQVPTSRAGGLGSLSPPLHLLSSGAAMSPRLCELPLVAHW